MRITLSSGSPAELALPPSGAEPSLGLALCPDVMGLRPLFDDLCARLAAEHGWAVCAVEPFANREHLALEDRLDTSLDDDRLLADLEDAAVRTGAARTAVTGFCMGGMLALDAAGTGSFDRAVAFYGMIRRPAPWSSPGHEPLETLAHAEACPTLAVLGGHDRYTPAADIEALRRVGDHVEVALYPEADHGFVHDPARPAHRPDDAADAWRRAVAFLSEPDG